MDSVTGTRNGRKHSRLGLRRFLARISIRLLAFNILLVFLPAAGASYLDTYERQLLQSQEQSMVQQGRLLAAALSERGALSQAMVEPLLVRLDQRTTSRIRVLDGERWLLTDTSRLGPQRSAGNGEDEPELSVRTSWLYQIGSSLFRLYDRIVGRPRPDVGEEFYPADRPFDGVEIQQALQNQYGAATRITPGGQRSVTLYSALPVENEGRVVGVVLVSQSTFLILQNLYETRLAVFRFLLYATAVAAVLSLLVSTTISRPLTRLRSEAHALLDRRGRLTGRFSGSERLDEIGDLSRALSGLSQRLEERMKFIESFAADVSHEFKNPLASIRSATEMLKDVDDPEARERFAHMVEGDIARLERLLSEVREITILDAQSDGAEDELVADVNSVLEGVVERQRQHGRGSRIELDTEGEPLPVRADADGLVRVFENLVDNAAGFSPDGNVRLSARANGRDAIVLVEDDGPGIAAEHGDKVFDRFFSHRPGTESAEHSGLGLAIVKAIVERHGGSIQLVPSSLGGAGFEVRLKRAN